MPTPADPFAVLANTRITLLGLGLMGGSLALALRGRCAALYGVDPDPQAVADALALQAVPAAASRLDAPLPPSDLIILAAPVRAILRLLHDLPAMHAGPALVLDIGSTKQAVMAAMAQLPPRFDPLGGHPMCGKEHSSIRYAEAGLFRQAPFALTPLERTTPAGRELGQALALALEARPLWLDAATHDRWVAATSHLPYLLANALSAATPPEALPLAGPGLRGAARLAGSSLTMMGDILATNREPVLAALQRLRLALDDLEQALQADDPARLHQALSGGQAAYAAIRATAQE